MINKCKPAPFSKGVNLTNWLEYRKAEDIRPDTFTIQDFRNIQSLGCDVVRLPIHFERFCAPENQYAIPDSVLAILDRAVSWAEETGLFLILDFHNATHVDSFTSRDVENILIPVWTQLASRYCESSEKVVYEIMNEPHGIEIPVWNEIILRVHRLIRSIDRNHYVVVGGADWNSTAGMKALPGFQDDRILYTFHFYDPHTFTHQGAPWCHMERVTGIPFPYDENKMPPLPDHPTEIEKRCFETYPLQGTLQAVTQYFDHYAEFSLARNAPLVCGEYGCNAFSVDKGQRVNWYRIVAGLLDERGIARISWDYYGPFGLFDLDWNRRMPPRKMFPPRFPEDLNQELLKALKLNCG